MSNVIKEFMDMKPGQRFLHDVGRIATALEKLAEHADTFMTLHTRGYGAKYGSNWNEKEKPPTEQEGGPP